MRLLCWLVAIFTLGFRGHRWRMLRINTRKHIALMHLHTMAGLDAACTRCGEEWRDAESVVVPGIWGDIYDVKGEVYVYPWDGPTHERLGECVNGLEESVWVG